VEDIRSLTEAVVPLGVISCSVVGVKHFDESLFERHSLVVAGIAMLWPFVLADIVNATGVDEVVMLLGGP